MAPGPPAGRHARFGATPVRRHEVKSQSGRPVEARTKSRSSFRVPAEQIPSMRPRMTSHLRRPVEPGCSERGPVQPEHGVSVPPPRPPSAVTARRGVSRVLWAPDELAYGALAGTVLLPDRIRTRSRRRRGLPGLRWICAAVHTCRGGQSRAARGGGAAVRAGPVARAPCLRLRTLLTFRHLVEERRATPRNRLGTGGHHGATFPGGSGRTPHLTSPRRSGRRTRRASARPRRSVRFNDLWALPGGKRAANTS